MFSKSDDSTALQKGLGKHTTAANKQNVPAFFKVSHRHSAQGKVFRNDDECNLF